MNKKGQQALMPQGNAATKFFYFLIGGILLFLGILNFFGKWANGVIAVIGIIFIIMAVIMFRRRTQIGIMSSKHWLFGILGVVLLLLSSGIIYWGVFDIIFENLTVYYLAIAICGLMILLIGKPLAKVLGGFLLLFAGYRIPFFGSLFSSIPFIGDILNILLGRFDQGTTIHGVFLIIIGLLIAFSRTAMGQQNVSP